MIDEKKLIEDIEKEFDGVCTYDVSPSRAVQDFTDIVDRQPKVGVWIPVSERLPENEYGVLVTVNGKHNNITFENALEIAEYDSIDGWIIEGYLDWTDPDVIAWQPLPEPYKAGDE